MNKKIVCLGAGSGYFTRAVADLAVTEGIAGSEVTMYDLDHEKCEIMTAHGSRLAEESGMGLRFRACEDLADALDGADFAVSSIGGSGASLGGVYGTGVHIADMIIPARYGVYQIIGDTTGPAGMMMGLRSIPAYIDICREMEKRCPKVILMSHSNPMAPLCRAMTKYTNIQVVGICHGVQGGIMSAASVLGVSPHELNTIWIGTNHYYWFTRICNNKGEDLYPEFWKRVDERGPVAGQLMSSRLSRIYGYQITYTPDDHIIDIDAAPGERLIVTLEETAGVATLPSVRLEFEEFSREELLAMAAGQRV